MRWEENSKTVPFANPVPTSSQKEATVPRRIIISLVAFALGALVQNSVVRASPPIGAVVQTWHYDPATNIVTLKIVNTSHKDITAFNIAITETYAGGRVEHHEMLEELMGKIIASKEFQGDTSRGAETFRKLYGDGAFHPGEVRDEKLGVQPGLEDYQAVIDVVAYMDATADANNNDALGRIIGGRQATVASEKISIDAIETALADTNDTTPAMTAAKKIQDRATVWKAQQHTKLDLDAGGLESMASALKSVSANSVDKQGALKQILSREESRMSVLSVHAALTKNGGPQ